MESGNPVVYSVSLEQQVRLIRRLLGPDGGLLVREDLFGEVGRRMAAELGITNARIARQVGGALREATPFFWASHIARAIREAVRTMPPYTFTAESFPCPWGFAWFEEPILLVEDEEGPQRLRALHWQVRPAESDGRVPVGLNGFLSHAGTTRPALCDARHPLPWRHTGHYAHRAWRRARRHDRDLRGSCPGRVARRGLSAVLRGLHEFPGAADHRQRRAAGEPVPARPTR